MYGVNHPRLEVIHTIQKSSIQICQAWSWTYQLPPKAIAFSRLLIKQGTNRVHPFCSQQVAMQQKIELQFTTVYKSGPSLLPLNMYRCDRSLLKLTSLLYAKSILLFWFPSNRYVLLNRLLREQKNSKQRADT
uniref:Uncharacterized protein n=1 Tax=Arundo donax TaxID=35708 RepID=A0A0A9D9P5_ARUDO